MPAAIDSSCSICWRRRISSSRHAFSKATAACAINPAPNSTSLVLYVRPAIRGPQTTIPMALSPARMGNAIEPVSSCSAACDSAGSDSAR